MKLTFDEFRKANLARKRQFFKDATVDNWSISDCFMAAAGELGEIANALKKVKRAELGMLNRNEEGRQINSLDEAKAKVAGEIGGFMCYLDQLADMLGLSLEDCIVDEFNKKSVELGLPERIQDGRYTVEIGELIPEKEYAAAGDRIATQRAEFDAVVKLADAYRAITMTAPVDDDYPLIRGRYESAMMDFLRAVWKNGRTLPPWK